MPDPARTQLAEEVQEYLHNIDKTFQRHLRDGMDGLPATPQQFGLLMAIDEQPGSTVSELARKFAMAKSNISEMVDRLSREGLLEKRRATADGRLSMLGVSSAGRRILADMKSRYQEVAQPVLATLSDEELAAVVHGLRLLHDALRYRCPPPGGTPPEVP